MAIISPIFGEMRGKLGGNVFSRNKGGPYVRRHAVPTNPNSFRQQATRNWVAWCASTWSSILVEAEREQWREWAKTHTWKNSLGQDIALTALDWYTMTNSRLLDCAATPIKVPDDLSIPDPLQTCVLALPTATTCTITFTPALPATGRLFLWGSGPLGIGQDPNFRQCVLVGYSAANAPSPVTFSLPWTIPTGSKLKIYCGVMSARGRCSTPLSDDEVKS